MRKIKKLKRLPTLKKTRTRRFAHKTTQRPQNTLVRPGIASSAAHSTQRGRGSQRAPARTLNPTSKESLI